MPIADLFPGLFAQFTRTAHFDDKTIDAVEKLVIKKNDKPYLKCLVRQKEVMAKPEEIVRQLWLHTLLHRYKYPLSRIQVEYPITFGRDSSKRADIVIFDADRPTVPYIIIEVKQATAKGGKEQLKSYTHATGAPLAVWSDGTQVIVWHRKNPNYFEEIPALPGANETIEMIAGQPWTIDTLLEYEKQRDAEGSKGRSLRQLIEDLEDEVLANAGVDVFEEVFKLIFTKLYDELSCYSDFSPHLRFRNVNTAAQTKKAIQHLFDEAREKWDGVFDDDKIRLTPEHLQVCVGSLEKWKLFNSNLDVVDEAFEYLVNKSSKGEKGQYFTPRWVIDLCVRMLNPKETETIIDTACGSAGFTVHSIFHVWRKILDDMGKPASHLFTMEKKPVRCLKYVQDKVFAIDFDEKSVRVSRCLNLIAGDECPPPEHPRLQALGRDDQAAGVDRHLQRGLEKTPQAHGGEERLPRVRIRRSHGKPAFRGRREADGHAQPLRTRAQTREGRRAGQARIRRRPRPPLHRAQPRLPPPLRPHGGRPPTGTVQQLQRPTRPRVHRRTLPHPRRRRHPRKYLQTPHRHKNQRPLRPEVERRSRRRSALQEGGRLPDLLRHPAPPEQGQQRRQNLREGREWRTPPRHPRSLGRPTRFLQPRRTHPGRHRGSVRGIRRQGKTKFFLSRPFNAKRYARLLEGLEITVMPLNEVLSLDDTGRIDSGFFTKEQIRVRAKASIWPFLGDYCESVSCGPFGSTILDTNYVEAGLPMIRPFNLREMRSDAGEIAFLPEEFVFNQSLKIFKRGDLMFARVGDVGCSLLVHERATISPNVIAASIKRSSLNPYFAAVFFNTPYGFLQMEGGMKVVAQPTISTELIRKLRVPNFSSDFQKQIERRFLESEALLLKARIDQSAADQTLLRALGLESWEPPEPLTYTRCASEALAAGRIDSDFFAPARYATIEKLSAMRHRLLRDCCDSIRDLFDPLDPHGITEVRNFDVTDALKPSFDDSKEIVPVQELGSTKKRFLNGDVAISRLRSYLRQIAVVRTSDSVPAVGSSEFIVLRPRAGISPELLMVFLRSKPVQTILKYCQEGNQHPRFGEGNLMEIPFPEVLLDHSDAIISQIRSAHAARQEAQSLLERAKRAVEIAIEEGEAAGMEFLGGCSP